MRQALTVLIFLLGLQNLAESSVDSNAIESTVDNLLKPLTDAHSPGFLVLVIKDGQVVVNKGYGSANIELGIPMSPNSVFYIASMSKQFTAAIAMRFALEGKLDLQAAVTDYLPKFPEYGHDIRVSDLIYHTAGLREYTSLYLMSGGDQRYENRLSMEDAWKLITDQQSLTFEPGTDYRYSSSNYIVLTRILETISGKSLDALARQYFFNPLSMSNTQFESEPARVVPHRVQSYQLQDGQLRRYFKRMATYGDGGILTTTEDMALWDRFLTKQFERQTPWAQRMLKKGQLRDGTEVDYAAGLGFGEVEGYPIIRHGGGMYGFISDQIRVPSQRLSIYLFANWNGNDAFQAFNLVRQLLPSNEKPESAPPTPALPTTDLAFLNGYYFLDDRNQRRYIMAKDGDIYYGFGEQATDTKLFRTGENELTFPDQSARVLFQRKPDGAVQLRLVTGAAGNHWTAESFDNTPPERIEQLRQLTGCFSSKEVHAVYRFFIENNTFQLQINRESPITLFPNPTDRRISWNGIERVWIGFAMIKFRRNAEGQFAALDVGDNRVSNLRFDRYASCRHNTTSNDQ